MILADEMAAFLGSENFSYGSLDQNRELGIFISDPDYPQFTRPNFFKRLAKREGVLTLRRVWYEVGTGLLENKCC